MGVPIQTDPSFTAGNPEVLFEGNYVFEQGGPTLRMADARRELFDQHLKGPGIG